MFCSFDYFYILLNFLYKHHIFIIFSNIFLRHSQLFKGFVEYAEMIVENGATSLVHSNFKFIRDRVDTDRSYWRCRHSFKYNCKARVVTKMVNGYEMVKIRNAEHNHTDIKTLKGKKRSFKVTQKRKPKHVPSKPKFAARIIRPQLTSKVVPQLSANVIPQMPKLKPKPVARDIDKDENNVPKDDAENVIVDILD